MEKRAGLTLRCSECKNENYIATKNKRTHPERLEVKKYCPHCKKSTLHVEKK
ncbi:MAG TPA: 50S ribosomal protein L33 [Firmicutes bacterium]|jgi:large subunit ribosomal protein L33|nr:50S ribosomal protein L33 2 [Clostridium sp. CAG:288]HAR46996.1 50S ribosomal protein L33 [Bacillota bacterium]HAX00994.1 50S ribosomal protein L33 [Bacillota bacterium]HCY68007.1 50S ribosomal protein L33 [Bacillota bacterium]